MAHELEGSAFLLLSKWKSLSPIEADSGVKHRRECRLLVGPVRELKETQMLNELREAIHDDGTMRAFALNDLRPVKPKGYSLTTRTQTRRSSPVLRA